jgi:uncharacterized protein YkwD
LPSQLFRLLTTLWLFASSVSGQQDPDSVRQNFLVRLNQERQAAGLPPLRLVDSLNQAAQQSAEEIGSRGESALDLETTQRIRRQLARTGYEAHGLSQSFAASPGDAGEVVTWWKSSDVAGFGRVIDADYQDLGIGVGTLEGTPLYTFLLAWQEGEYFARQTASLSELAQVRAAMLEQVNRERAAVGAPPLVLNRELNEAAQKHAEDMLARSYYNHDSLEGLQPRDRVRQTGYTAREEVMQGWMQSRGHRGNLLHAGFSEMGVGCAVGRNSVGYTVLWVQNFGRPQ